MGNGPSLRNLLKDQLSILKSTPCMAVNFAANTPDFFEVKPRYYTIADPHFYKSASDANVNKLIENLKRVDWDLTLYVPHGAAIIRSLLAGSRVKIVFYNAIGIEGWNSITNYAFDHKLGMPRPRNVLIPSIMLGAWMGFSNIYLAGADHSWTRTLSVAPDNRVITNLPHFYTDNEHELQRIDAVYTNHHLHDLFLSYHIAFKAYHEIQAWAIARNIHIY
ncbi:MAG: hypothetical protein K2G40_06530, partial [Muribaculaceae bacterium]|nr:hypothetical protein [Muribaculaceae bacterium]